ncbi:MAG: hypothetical protein MRY64_13480 [Hyphomonadaceae bacterium]|nr:hypothetical protein [Hyphomonadaceae bacterium]
MFDSIQSIAGGLAVFTAAFAAGAAWITTVAAPNCSFDRLDYSRADGHVRQLMRNTSGPIAVVLLAACALAVLAGAYGSATLSGLAAAGFLTNTWTLAPKKKGEGPPPGVRHRKKSQRIVAVSLSLMFTAVAGIASILAVFNV